MLLGLIKPTSGRMKLLGLTVQARRREALARVGASVDEPRFHAHLTGRKNLWALAAAREPEAHARIDTALERVGLSERADDRVAKYSMGMRQRPGIAACLIADPELLILDEPDERSRPGRNARVPRADQVARRRRADGRPLLALAR
jgi:ABC-2 type transport system ATP-binding protein